MKHIFLVLVAAAIGALGGCATTPHRLTNAVQLAADGSAFAGKATVYVLRDSSGSGMAWPVTVKMDGISQGSIRRETYVWFGVTPGRHDLLASWPALSGEPDVAVNAEFLAGKTYYFVFGTSFGIAGRAMRLGAGLGQIDVANATQRLRTYVDRNPVERN